MMKNKYKKNIIIILSCIAFISLSAFVYNNFIRIRNIFDLMYYDRIHNKYSDDYFTPTPKNKFDNMEQIKVNTRGTESGYVEYGCFFEKYKSKYLPKDCELTIEFYVKDKLVYINYEVNSSTENKWYCYIYSVNDKTLTYTTNDPDDTENRRFLYNIFLTDWFNANPSWRFSIDNLGDITFIDTTIIEE